MSTNWAVAAPVPTSNWSVGASVATSDLKFIRVYGLNPEGYIMEWQHEGSGNWTGPAKIGPRATPGSTITALLDSESSTGAKIRVYFHAEGRIYELRYDVGWQAPIPLP